jgi:hypothetical protein
VQRAATFNHQLAVAVQAGEHVGDRQIIAMNNARRAFIVLDLVAQRRLCR